MQFLDDRFLLQVVQAAARRRHVSADASAASKKLPSTCVAFAPRINTAYYHGGEPIRIIRPFLEGGERKPYFLAMTAAGQSALNVQRARYGRHRRHAVRQHHRARTRTCSRKMHLGANEILQMAGRVHGRVEGGRVFILSDRDIQFESLQPTEPEFQLAGDSERVAMTCADLGVDATTLDLPVPLDRVAYRNAVDAARATRHRREGPALDVRQARSKRCRSTGRGRSCSSMPTTS